MQKSAVANSEEEVILSLSLEFAILCRGNGIYQV